MAEEPYVELKCVRLDKIHAYLATTFTPTVTVSGLLFEGLVCRIGAAVCVLIMLLRLCTVTDYSMNHDNWTYSTGPAALYTGPNSTAAVCSVKPSVPCTEQ